MQYRSHPLETGLIEHYNKVLGYWSPLRDYSFAELAGMLSAEITEPILDLGCGDGRLAGQLGCPVDGVDISERRIAIAKNKYPKCSWYCADLYWWLGRCRRKYGMIVAIDVFEHLEEPDLALRLALSLLNESGVLLATVPINLPYKAHLQVYQSTDSIQECLMPDQLIRVGKFALCLWRRKLS